MIENYKINTLKSITINRKEALGERVYGFSAKKLRLCLPITW